MDKNPFLKRLMHEKKEDVVHTSAFSEAQNAGKIGAASAQSFEKRVQIEQNRSNVRGYGDSKIVHETWGNKLKPKTYDATKDQAPAERLSVKSRLNEQKKIFDLRRGASTGAEGQNDATRKMAQPSARKNPGIFR